MATIVLLDLTTASVEFVKLSEEQVNEIENEYNDNVEAWLGEKFDSCNIRVRDCSWMYVDDYPEIYEHQMRDGKWSYTQIFTTY